MKKEFKVITINGIRGAIAAIFIVMGLIAGFIVSPGWVCMQLWNQAIEEFNLVVSTMNIYQGIMLWAIIALSLYALNNKRALIGFGSYKGLSPEQVKDIMSRAKDSEDKILKQLEAMAKEKIEKEEVSLMEENITKNEETDNEKEKVEV
ncbi:hypothetical protein IJD15_02195 [bacterium]|nr:hypothetical protein [bacterium]